MLVYDIGLHDGQDTARYLREGCRVVAIDANPMLCAAAETLFRDAVRTGRLTVINRGLAERSGQLEFWVCDEVSAWSSFHRALASRDGAKHHAITVECATIMDIVDEFGIADYMKIDIEGNDRLCIAGLEKAAAPKYISIEMDLLRGDQDILRLAELGYRDFKVICQNNAWHQVTTQNIWFYRWGPGPPVIRQVRWLRAAAFRHWQGRRLGESGPWGEESPGEWHDLEHARSVWRLLHELEEQRGAAGSGWWFDVHARK
jgi:FkbM family methyltransferase